MANLAEYQKQVLMGSNGMPYPIEHNYTNLIPTKLYPSIIEHFESGYSDFEVTIEAFDHFHLLSHNDKDLKVKISLNILKQAYELLKTLGVSFSTIFLGQTDHFEENVYRDTYLCLFKRESKTLEIRFGQSVAKKGTTPRPYDVMACITKSDPIDFENFCWEFGYDEDSRKAEKTFKAVQKEWEKVSNFFTYEELILLQNIQ